MTRDIGTGHKIQGRVGVKVFSMQEAEAIPKSRELIGSKMAPSHC